MSKKDKSRQKKLARQKAKRKANQQTGTPRNDLLRIGLNAPLTDCVVYGDQKQGMMTVSLFRSISGGNGVTASFCVDLYCLGIKDSFVNTAKRATFNEMMARQADSRPISPEDAKKLIEGAVAFAASCGFEPHPDFNKAMRYLDDVDSLHSTAVFEYGKNGKPLFIADPNDSPETCKSIIDTLETTLGDGNFDVIMPKDGFS